MRALVLIIVSIALYAGIDLLRAQAPSGKPGCVFNTVLPTLSDKQTVALQCDTSGRLQLH